MHDTDAGRLVQAGFGEMPSREERERLIRRERQSIKGPRPYHRGRYDWRNDQDQED